MAAPVAVHVRKVEAEVNVLKQLHHANIVRYLVSIGLYILPNTHAARCETSFFRIIYEATSLCTMRLWLCASIFDSLL